MLAACSPVAFVHTADLARARAFYVDLLGLRLVEETPFAVVVSSGGATPGGGRVAWFLDPDRNTLSLSEPASAR